MSPNELCSRLLDSLAVTLHNVNLGGQGRRWPEPYITDTMAADLCSAGPVLCRFKECYDALKAQGKSDEQIGKLFRWPSVIMRLILNFKCKEGLRISTEEQIAIFEALARVAAPLYRRDIFCLEKTNILWDNAQLGTLKTPLPADDNARRLLSQIDGKLWMYTEMLFTRWHNLGHEYHGPYDVTGGKVLIKEWHDLKPEFWTFHASFPYESLRCVEFYKEADVRIDLHNRMESSPPLSQAVTAFYIEANDRQLTLAEMQQLSDELDRVLEAGVRVLAQFTTEHALLANAEMQFFVIKPLATALHKDWRPPHDVSTGYNDGTARRLSARFSAASQTRDTLKQIYSPWTATF